MIQRVFITWTTHKIVIYELLGSWAISKCLLGPLVLVRVGLGIVSIKV